MRKKNVATFAGALNEKGLQEVQGQEQLPTGGKASRKKRSTNKKKKKSKKRKRRTNKK